MWTGPMGSFKVKTMKRDRQQSCCMLVVRRLRVMRITSQTAALFLVLGLLAGCSFGRYNHYSVNGVWNGVCQVKQADHVVYLRPSREDLSGISKPGYYLLNIFPNANCYILELGGKDVPLVISSVTGTDQYGSNSPQPMESVYIRGPYAVLAPKSCIITNSSLRVPTPPPGIGFGEHKLYIQYMLNGQPYVFHFDLDYSVKAKYEFHWIGEWHDWN